MGVFACDLAFCPLEKSVPCVYAAFELHIGVAVTTQNSKKVEPAQLMSNTFRLRVWRYKMLN